MPELRPYRWKGDPAKAYTPPAEAVDLVRERKREARARYRARYPERCREQNRRWREANRETINAKARARDAALRGTSGWKRLQAYGQLPETAQEI